jgi:glycosyltransferase involved in cell wall biosynthesis
VRITIATWTRRRAGGVETYLAALIPALLAQGHEVSLAYEADEPAEREPFARLPGVREWSLAEPDEALGAVANWGPDVVFIHGLEDPGLESRIAALAPAVLFAHAYRGTCISGTKSFATPDFQACDRVLGWPCLAHYLPRQCGGLSPATMMRLFRRESNRRDRFAQYHGVLAFSEHIAAEYIRHGVPASRMHRVPAHITPPAGMVAKTLPEEGPIRLVFMGRMEPLKGADRLLRAIPLAQTMLQRPLHLTFAGDGRSRGELQVRAMQAERRPVAAFDFVGWLSAAERDQLLAESHLLVVPSLWPEPFGLVGLEAAGHGIPAASFGLGGITDWLKDGISGFIADADSPRPEALASAIVRCVQDPATYARLSAGALTVASRHSMEAHLRAVTEVLLAAAGTGAERQLA